MALVFVWIVLPNGQEKPYSFSKGKHDCFQNFIEISGWLENILTSQLWYINILLSFSVSSDPCMARLKYLQKHSSEIYFAWMVKALLENINGKTAKRYDHNLNINFIFSPIVIKCISRITKEAHVYTFDTKVGDTPGLNEIYHVQKFKILDSNKLKNENAIRSTVTKIC